jgi:signal transduction histidine kinase
VKRTWPIWALLFGCVFALIALMAWLTERALRLEHAEAVIRQRIVSEDAIGNTLWKMDAELANLLANEIARPATDFHIPPGQAAPSVPFDDSFVRLYFEISQDNRWTSPQLSSPEFSQLAQHVQIEMDPSIDQRLESLAASVRYEQLFAKLPDSFPRSEMIAAHVTPNVPSEKIAINQSLQQALEQQRKRTKGKSPIQQAAAPDVDSIERLQQRNELFQSTAQSAFESRNHVPQEAVDRGNAVPRIMAGVSQPLWIDKHLILARKILLNGEVRIQGCWFDWAKLEAHLLKNADEWIPSASLEPVYDFSQANLSRVLATIPAQVVVADVPVAIAGWTPIRIAVAIGWIVFGIALWAIIALVHGILSLSERRAAFVSAVSHELRTPLTTFRMYSEMLAEGMVTNERQRNEYLATLRSEAERLSLLVENVLQYARLERGTWGNHRETLTVQELVRRFQDRITRRARESGFELAIYIGPEARNRPIHIDPTAVEQILFNLVDNACKYAAGGSVRKVDISIRCDDRLRIRVRDYGHGISAETVRGLFRPFSKTANQTADASAGVGLGLALCRRLAKSLNGSVNLERNSSDGATFLITVDSRPS